jgi:hypothetical protein
VGFVDQNTWNTIPVSDQKRTPNNLTLYKLTKQIEQQKQNWRYRTEMNECKSKQLARKQITTDE